MYACGDQMGREWKTSLTKAIIECNPNETDKSVVITTCHNREPLSEAVWFFFFFF
jgi:hypothetical protein